MRLLLLLLSFITIQANAQSISGIAKDDSGNPLSGATITLYRALDTAVVKLAVTSSKGEFQFSDISNGFYRAGVSHVGFNGYISEPFEFAGSSITIPAINMTKVSGNMAAVTVTAKKPMVEVKADKTILNVEGTVNAMGSDALELLRKAPGVSVDKNNNLSVSGKSGVQVFIDGRPTPLSGDDLANYLKSMQSTEVEAIEIITNPSARFEAAGNGGIINIRLKKNKAFGTNGSVNAGYNIGTYPKYTTGLNLNHRNKLINVFGNYNFNKGENLTRFSLDRSVADTFFSTRNSMINDNLSHNFKLGVDLFLNARSTVGILVNGSVADPAMKTSGRTSIIPNNTKVTDRILEANNTSDMSRENINYNINYSYINPDGRTLTLNADHGIFNINNDQYQPNVYYDASGQNILYSVIYRMISPSEIRITSGKADWEQNFAKGKLGFGGKVSIIRTDNDFRRYNEINSMPMIDRQRSNRFNYEENINAGYVNYNRSFKGFMIQAGVRVENTVNDIRSRGEVWETSDFKAYDSSYERNYTDVFPSAAITFNSNPMSQFSLTYSRRIDRPAYQDLNPFELKIDEYTFMKGNVNLRPQYTNSFGLTHTYKYRLNTTINYSHVMDMFVQLPDTTEKSKSFLSKRNLATQDVISLNISYPFSYKSFTAFMNLNSNYSMYKATFEGRTIDLNALGLTAYVQNSYRFGKWTAEMVGFYMAPTVFMGTFQSETMWSIDLGIQRTIFNDRATIKASVSDIFNTMQFKGKTEFAGQRSDVLAKWESRQFKLALNFRFGSNSVKAARQRALGAEEEAKRAQQQNGQMGIGN